MLGDSWHCKRCLNNIRKNAALKGLKIEHKAITGTLCWRGQKVPIEIGQRNSCGKKQSLWALPCKRCLDNVRRIKNWKDWKMRIQLAGPLVEEGTKFPSEKDKGSQYTWQETVSEWVPLGNPVRDIDIVKGNMESKGLKRFTVVMLITKFLNMAHCDVSMATQWAPGPLHPKGKIRVSLSSKCYLLLMFIQWVWANMDITQHKHKKVC